MTACIIVCILCLSGIIALMTQYYLISRRDCPPLLKHAVEVVNKGYIPNELAGHIPAAYELSEGYSMTAELDRTFAQRCRRPLWAVRLVLDDGEVISDQVVLFDANGDLYQ